MLRRLVSVANLRTPGVLPHHRGFGEVEQHSFMLFDLFEADVIEGDTIRRTRRFATLTSRLSVVGRLRRPKNLKSKI